MTDREKVLSILRRIAKGQTRSSATVLRNLGEIVNILNSQDYPNEELPDFYERAEAFDTQRRLANVIKIVHFVMEEEYNVSKAKTITVEDYNYILLLYYVAQECLYDKSKGWFTLFDFEDDNSTTVYDLRIMLSIFIRLLNPPYGVEDPIWYEDMELDVNEMATGSFYDFLYAVLTAGIATKTMEYIDDNSIVKFIKNELRL